MENGEIFAMLTIYDENGEYYTQFEENLMAEKLNKLQNVSFQNSPISLVSNEVGFFAVVNDYIEPLTPDSEVNNANAVSLLNENNTDKKNGVALLLLLRS